MALGSLRLQLGLLVAVVREPNRHNLELNSSRASARARACGPPAAHICAARLITARVDLCRFSHDSFLPRRFAPALIATHQAKVPTASSLVQPQGALRPSHGGAAPLDLSRGGGVRRLSRAAPAEAADEARAPAAASDAARVLSRFLDAPRHLTARHCALTRRLGNTRQSVRNDRRVNTVTAASTRPACWRAQSRVNYRKD